MDLPSKERMCHRTGFEKSCRELVTSGACERWINIQGMHPQTGESINRYNCIDDWMPWLQIENSKLQRETGAAVESFRNQMVTANERMVALGSAQLKEHLLLSSSELKTINGSSGDSDRG